MDTLKIIYNWNRVNQPTNHVLNVDDQIQIDQDFACRPALYSTIVTQSQHWFLWKIAPVNLV